MKFFKDFNQFSKIMGEYSQVKAISYNAGSIWNFIIEGSITECIRRPPKHLQDRLGETKHFLCLEQKEANGKYKIFNVPNNIDIWSAYGRGTWFLPYNIKPYSSAIIRCADDIQAFIFYVERTTDVVPLYGIDQYNYITFVNIYCVEDNSNPKEMFETIRAFAKTGKEVPIVVYVSQEVIPNKDELDDFAQNLRKESIGCVVTEIKTKLMDIWEYNKKYLEADRKLNNQEVYEKMMERKFPN